MTSRRLIVLAALIELIAPVAAAGVLLFGGGAIGNCHVPVGDRGTLSPVCPVQVVVWPPLQTAAGIAVSLAICAASWLAANYVLLAHLATDDRPRLLRLVVAIAIAGIAMANVGFAYGLRFRLLYAAEGAVSWGIAGLLLAWIVAMAWAGLRLGQRQHALA